MQAGGLLGAVLLQPHPQLAHPHVQRERCFDLGPGGVTGDKRGSHPVDELVVLVANLVVRLLGALRLEQHVQTIGTPSVDMNRFAEPWQSFDTRARTRRSGESGASGLAGM